MKENIKLTRFSSGAGWACKLSPEDLSQVLRNLNNTDTDNALIDFSSFDDAAAFNINENTILQTVDFFTPIVDDPYDFGRISAANSLSDIYAMGGEPKFALNIVAFPSDDLPLDILTKIILLLGQKQCSFVIFLTPYKWREPGSTNSIIVIFKIKFMQTFQKTKSQFNLFLKFKIIK